MRPKNNFVCCGFLPLGQVILDSTLITLCISLGCVFLGVLVFTRSTHLAIIVMTIVLTIVVGLLFFMVIVLGPKEAVTHETESSHVFEGAEMLPVP